MGKKGDLGGDLTSYNPKVGEVLGDQRRVTEAISAGLRGGGESEGSLLRSDIVKKK